MYYGTLWRIVLEVIQNIKECTLCNLFVITIFNPPPPPPKISLKQQAK